MINRPTLTYTTQSNHPESVFGYLLLQVNEASLFSTVLNKGEVFELYDLFMDLYSQPHGTDYDPENVAQNMDLLFNSEDVLSKEEKLSVNSFVDAAVETYMDELEAQDTGLVMDVGAGNKGDMVFLIPGTIYLQDEEPFSDGQFEQLNDLLDSFEVREVSGVDGLFEGYRLTPEGYHVDSFMVMTTAIDILNKEILAIPEAYVQGVIKLQGVPQKDISKCIQQITVAVEVLAFDSDYQIEPHWSDVLDFIYNHDGLSVSLLNKYKLSDEYNDFIDEFDDGVFQLLYDHVSDIKNNDRLTSYSYWLLSYVDMLGMSLFHEERRI